MTIAFPRYLFFFRQNGIRAAEIDDDVALLEALHDAVDELAFAPFEFVVDDLALRVAQALDDILFGGLRGDSSEEARIELAEQLVADLGIGVEVIFRVLQT